MNDFDESSIRLRFALVSDLHIQDFKGATPNLKFINALKQIKEMGKIDAVVVAGDVTDWGQDVQIENLREILQEYMPDGAEFLFCLGNHDIQDNYYTSKLGGTPFKKILGDMIYKGSTEEEINIGNDHRVVNGYHFIMLTHRNYKTGLHDEADLLWLKTQLDQAVKEDPTKPIFIATHSVVYNTYYGSNEGTYWHSKNIAGLLKDYPQVIIGSGHLHFPLNNDRIIHQDTFTGIGTATTYYCSLHETYEGHKFIENRGFEPYDCQIVSQGMIIEVDANNNTRITRYDFQNREQIKQPFIVPTPKPDKSHLLPYNLDLVTKKATKPWFDKNAKINVNFAYDSKVQIKFDAAKDDDMVYAYQLDLFNDKDELVGTAMSYSDFYHTGNPKNMSKTLTKTLIPAHFGIEKFEGSLTLKIRALNCYYKFSDKTISTVVCCKDANSSPHSQKQMLDGYKYAPIYNFGFWDKSKNKLGQIDDTSCYFISANGAGSDYEISVRTNSNESKKSMEIKSKLTSKDQNRNRCIEINVPNPNNEFFSDKFINPKYFVVKLKLENYKGYFGINPMIFDQDFNLDGSKAAQSLFSPKAGSSYKLISNGKCQNFKTDSAFMVAKDNDFDGYMLMPLDKDSIEAVWGTSDKNNKFDGQRIGHIFLNISDIGERDSKIIIEELAFLI